MSKHAYGNTRAADFWNAMAKASGKPVDKVMPTWVEQAGAPMLSVKAQCTGNQTTVELSQTRFFNDPELLKREVPELWQIPVCIKTADAQAPRCELMTQKQQAFKLNGCSPWVFVNAGGQGYYWSAYSPELTAKLADVAEQALTPQERVSLLNDEWALVRAGQHPISQYLSLAQGMRSDPHTTGGAADRGAGGVHVGRPGGARRSRRISRVGPAISSVRCSTSSAGARSRATATTSRACAQPSSTRSATAARDPEVLRRASELAQQYMKDPASVDPNLGGLALQLAALNGDAKLYDEYDATHVAGQVAAAVVRVHGGADAFFATGTGATDAGDDAVAGDQGAGHVPRDASDCSKIRRRAT